MLRSIGPLPFPRRRSPDVEAARLPTGSGVGALSLVRGGTAALGIALGALAAACSADEEGTRPGASPSSPAAVPATVELLAERGGALAAATETVRLARHAGALWASTSQWKAPEPGGGAVLRKRGPEAPWTVVLRSDQRRVMALESFTVPARRNGGAAAEVLLTQARVDGRSELRWLVGDADDLSGRFPLESARADARSLGGHAEGDGFAFYAGVRPTGILRGEWRPEPGTIAWSREAELAVGGGRIDRKVTGFASCGGAMWATVRETLYRRREGDLASGAERWSRVYTAPVENARNSGLRGLTCIEHDGGPALLVAKEGRGEILRFDARGDEESSRADGSLSPVVEADLRELVHESLRATGHALPARGRGAVGYVLPAYNEMLEIADGVYLTGVEWSYRGGRCPETRVCQPERTFDAAACTLRRERRASGAAWSLACLGGEATPAPSVNVPVRPGESFVAVRALRPSPWVPGDLYLAGYDANFVASEGTAWIARVERARLLP